MAMNNINQAWVIACDETSPGSTEAGQPASPQQASRIVLRSASERKPVLLRPPGSPVARQRNAIAPGSPCTPVAGQADDEASSQSRPILPLSSTLVRRINRLAGDDDAKNSRSLLRLHGGDATDANDPLAPLNIQWLISTEEPVAPGASSRATPSSPCMRAVAGSPPAMPASPAQWQAAEPARTQVSGKRSLVKVNEHADRSPRKKQKIVHHQEALTPVADECGVLAPQTPSSPLRSSPQTSGPDIAADLSPPSEIHASAAKSGPRSWKASALKRRAKLPGREFRVWRESIPGIGRSGSPVRTQQSPVQQASQALASSATITPVTSHEKPLS